MMKTFIRKLGVALCTLIVGVTAASAVTVSDLETMGWTRATSLDDISSNYYIFVDAGSSLYAMQRGASNVARPRYNTIANPLTSLSQVWIIEADGSNFNIRAVEDHFYFSTGGSGWDDNMTGKKVNSAFTFTLNNGKYDIRGVAVSGNNYMGHWNDSGSGVNLAGNNDWSQGDGMEDIAVNKAQTNAPGFYLYKISRSEFLSAYTQNATSANPINVTLAITNNSFETGDTSDWTLSGTSSDTKVCTSEGNYATAGTDGTYLFNTWWRGVALTQTLSDLPSGKFRLTTSIASSDANADAKIFLLGNGTHSDVITITRGTQGTFNDYSFDFHLTSNSTTIGIVGGDDNGNYVAGGHWWYKTDNFRLYYLNPDIKALAKPLPENGAMVAGQWYYKDITVAGDNYSATADALNNIVYTIDGTILQENESGVTAKFVAENNNLTATRYYVKSSTANNLVLQAASYTYNIGTATVSHHYVQGGETVTINYADAATNNTGATFAKNGNPAITFGGNAVEITPTNNGFTFTVPTVTPATDYTLAIPANAFGYDAGSTYNDAQNITIHAATVFDGTYYVKVAATTNGTTVSTTTGTVGKYLARGAAWGTHATVDTYGLAVNITTDSEGYSLLGLFDTSRYYFTTGEYDVYADRGNNNLDDDTKFIITKDGGYLKISSKNHPANFFKHNDADANSAEASIYFDGTGTNAGPIILWEIETLADHATAMTALKNSQAATAAAAAYADDASTYATLNNVSTVAELTAAAVNLPYSKVVVGGNVPTSVTEKYQGGQPNPAPEEVYSSSLSIPAPGLYRFSMQAFYRASNNNVTQNMSANGADFPPVVLFFGDSETQIKSVYDESSATALTTATDWTNLSWNGAYYPNDTISSLNAFQAGMYNNDVWFYAPAAGNYKYGVKYMGHANQNAQWFIYSPQAVTVTYYGVDDSYFDKLKAEIDKANVINSYYNNAALTSEIATAQAMYDAYTAKQTQVNSEVTSLQALYPTAVSIANGDFDTAPVYKADGTVSDAVQTISNNGNLYVVSNFDNSASGNEWVYGLNAEYGSTLQLNGVTPPTADIYGESEGAALGLSAGWGHNAIYKQDISLNSGRYLLYYEYYNQNSASASVSSNLTGLDDTHSTKTNGFTPNAWGRDHFTVDIYENGTYALSVGMYGEGSSNANAKLWIDNVELYRLGDAVGSVNTEGNTVTVLGDNDISDINAALTSGISILNLNKATGLTNATINTTNNPNLLIYAKDGQVNNSNNVIVDETCSTLSLVDGHPFVVPTTFTATTANFTLSAVADDGAGNKYATLVLPFDASTLAGTAYTLNQGVSISTEEIYGTAVSSITANKPVLVTSAGTYSGYNVKVSAISTEQTFTNGELIGTYTAMTAPEGSYVLQKHDSRLAFYLVGSVKPTVSPFRAYIRAQAANAKLFTVVFDNSVTAISGVSSDRYTNADAEIFSVGGVRQTNIKRGINIIRMSDGTVHKVIVK